MNHINTPHGKIQFNPSVSRDGRHYRLSAISKNSQLPSKLITGRGECWHWIYTFIYTDSNELFSFEFDYNDKFVGKVNTQTNNQQPKRN